MLSYIYVHIAAYLLIRRFTFNKLQSKRRGSSTSGDPDVNMFSCSMRKKKKITIGLKVFITNVIVNFYVSGHNFI